MWWRFSPRPNRVLSYHPSETLVRCVVEHEGLKIPDTVFGEQGKSGILKDQARRKAFLEDAGHRVQCLYTPKHCSWRNPMECWFSIPVRRLLNQRSSFTSVATLEERLREFIAYYNQYLAKPFNWHYQGELLQAS